MERTGTEPTHHNNYSRSFNHLYKPRGSDCLSSLSLSISSNRMWSIYLSIVPRNTRGIRFTFALYRKKNDSTGSHCRDVTTTTVHDGMHVDVNLLVTAAPPHKGNAESSVPPRSPSPWTEWRTARSPCWKRENPWKHKERHQMIAKALTKYFCSPTTRTAVFQHIPARDVPDKLSPFHSRAPWSKLQSAACFYYKILPVLDFNTNSI